MLLASKNPWMSDEAMGLPSGAMPVGYAWLVRAFALEVMPNHRWSFVGKVARQSLVEQGIVWETLPLAYGPDDLPGHIEFALRYDGVNLEILAAMCAGLGPAEIEEIRRWILRKPTGAYTRKAWFLLEMLTGQRLDLRRGFTPPGTIVPVSATMLARLREYDACLERFSAPLMARVQYELDAQGHLEILGDTAGFYRYFDATPMVESLYGWLAQAIDHDFVDELEFVVVHGEVRRRLQEVVELPAQLENQLVARCLENNGRLSNSGRKSMFPMLTDEEVAGVEALISEVRGGGGGEPSPASADGSGVSNVPARIKSRGRAAAWAGGRSSGRSPARLDFAAGSPGAVGVPEGWRGVL